MKITTPLVILFVVAFLGLVGGFTVIIVTGHDAALYVTNIGILLTAVAGFIASIRQQQKTAEDVQIVKTNTNGTLSGLMNEVRSLQAKLNQALALLSPDHASDVLETTINKTDVPPVVPVVIPVTDASVTPGPVD